MFTKTPKTVASVLTTFTKTIAQLDQIAQDNMVKASALGMQRNLIDEQVFMADLEVANAKTISNKLQNLIGQDVPE